MQDNSLYKIIFEGQIKAGQDFNQVKARLASLFKVDIPVIESSGYLIVKSCHFLAEYFSASLETI